MIGSLLIILLGIPTLFASEKYKDYQTNKKCKEYRESHPYVEYKTRHEIVKEMIDKRIMEDAERIKRDKEIKAKMEGQDTIYLKMI